MQIPSRPFSVFPAALLSLTLAAVASIRHEDTDYDDLLESGVERAEARARVAPRVDQILDRWRDGC